MVKKKEIMNNKFNYEETQKKVLEQLHTGESMFGKNGALTPLIKQFIEGALDAEMEAHLSEEERKKGNKRNGRGKKTLKTNHGEIEIYPPEDRHSSFNPQTVKKRETILADSFQKKL